ncbi:MAG: DUF1289 domain-containing protein [Sphingomonadales bacterium]|nr:DUF1289 domain-containing protein [Sphingomonadales bacterium]
MAAIGQRDATSASTLGTDGRPPSPCKAICTLDRSASVCIGCGRTLGEIAEWGSATASRQHEIVRRSSARMGSGASHPA